MNKPIERKLPVYLYEAKKTEYMDFFDYKMWTEMGFSVFERENREATDLVEDLIKLAPDADEWAEYAWTQREFLQGFLDFDISKLNDIEVDTVLTLAYKWYQDERLEDLADCLTVLTGNKHIVRTIRGTSQSDWANVILPESEEWQLDYLESEFFGMFDEYLVRALGTDDWVGYTICWSIGQDKTDLANQLGCKLENIKFLNEGE